VRGSKYTRELLAPIVSSSVSLSEVIRKLGLVPNGGNHRMISTRVRQAGLDTSHFKHGKLRAAVESVSREDLTELVRRSLSVAQVLAGLALPVDGRAHHELTHRLERDGIDTTHLRGAGWARGETKATHPSVASAAAKNRRTDAEIFVAVSPIGSNSRLVRRLLAMGWKYECAECRISRWLDKPLVLHLDHINGIHSDNRLENLRLLCPNCHSQTDTYGNRPRRGASRASDVGAWRVLGFRRRERGVIGSRDGFRHHWGNPWGFESPRSHSDPVDENSVPCRVRSSG
jgi:5-methylcytosine-specific restriction endonuclease McrA